MAIAWKFLNPTVKQLGATATTVVSNAASTVTHICSIVLCNIHTSAVTVTLYVVPDNATAVGTAAAADEVIDPQDCSLAAGETLTLNDIHFILSDQGDSLQGLASVASKINIKCFGWEAT